MKVLQAISSIWIYNYEKYYYVLYGEDIAKIKWIYSKINI
jgi:hypothetical protein